MRPWSQALRRVASRQRVDHDPLLSPSAAHIGALARAISRRAAHGMAESIDDAVASPLPRTESHMVGVMSDGDAAIQAQAPNATFMPTSLSGKQNIAVVASINAAQLRGLAITEYTSNCNSAMHRQDTFAPEVLLSLSGEGTAADDVHVVSNPLVNMAGDSTLVVDKHLSTSLLPHVHPSLAQLQSSPSSTSSLLPQPTMRTVKMIRHRVRTTDTLEGVSVHYGINISHLKRLNRLWHPTEMATRDFLYIPLRMCLPRFTPANIEYNNTKYEDEVQSGCVPTASPVDLIEVVLNPTACLEPDSLAQYQTQTTSRPSWPLISYKSIQQVFSFSM
ncbi:hypothetical protein H4R24_002740 [Coemansia sp. RSA 988]|nr:hypothetical protein H4R24_002740 [Coemansia sp. RSA 988]